MPAVDGWEKRPSTTETVSPTVLSFCASQPANEMFQTPVRQKDSDNGNVEANS